jgi:hypothetical protein
MNYVDRPAFSEGQLLSAAELQLAVDYPRGELETHASVAHTSGVVDGMTFDFLPPVEPGGETSVYVTPGLAVDDLGRQISIASAMIVVPDPLAGQPASAGPFPAYVWYTEAPVASAAAVINPCATSSNDVIRESANVGVFTDNATARGQLPHAVCLGYLGWTGTSFEKYTGKDVRQGGGVRAHNIVAPANSVAVYGETEAATTFSVKGRLQAVAPEDQTPPVLAVPGGALVLSPSATPLQQEQPSSAGVSLSYFQPDPTAHGLAVNLGSDDVNSEVKVESLSGTRLASIDGTGTIRAAGADVRTLTATTDVVVTTGKSTLTLGPTQPNNIAGITASDTLALAFGSAASDEVTFVGGGAQVATIDANTVTSNGVQIGTLDASKNINGLGITSGFDLQIRTNGGDLLFNPETAGLPSPPSFRLTAKGRLMNQTVSPSVDVTPLASSGADGSVLQLGTLAIAFGTITAKVNPLAAQAPSPIPFPVTFRAKPAFFVAVSGAQLQTIFAVATAVSTTSATYRVSRFNPDAPKNANPATWSSSPVDVTVSWVALGELA